MSNVASEKVEGPAPIKAVSSVREDGMSMTRTPVKGIVGKKLIPPRWTVRAAMALRRGLQRIADGLTPPEVLVMEHMSVLGKPIAIAIATQKGIPDALANRGPLTAAELAPIVGANADILHRMLRYLSCFDVFEIDREGRFSSTRVSSQLKKEGVMHNAARLLGGNLNVTLWADLERTLQSGQSAFERLYGPVWPSFASNPNEGIAFVNGMASMTAMEAPVIAAAFPYGRFAVLCDVGGGSGILLVCILTRFPKLRAMLVDHEATLAHARDYLTDAGVLQRVELLVGDFFQTVPLGADAYMLKDILHDWTDEQCCRILKTIRSAMREGTTLLHETLAEIDSLGPAAIMDSQMALTNGGRNRGAAEFRDLLGRCGFRLERITRLLVPTSILEAVAV